MKIAIFFCLIASGFCYPRQGAVEPVSATEVPVSVGELASGQVLRSKDVPSTQNRARCLTKQPEPASAQQYVPPAVVLETPVEDVNKVLVELEEVVNKIVPDELDLYQDAAVAPGAPAPSGEEVQQQGFEVGALIQELESLQQRLQDTIESLNHRRRYLLAAMIRPMVSYVRRIRYNLGRLQVRLSNVQNEVSSQNATLSQRPPLVDSSAIENIRRRVQDVERRVGDIVGRIRVSLSPAPVASPDGVAASSPSSSSAPAAPVPGLLAPVAIQPVAVDGPNAPSNIPADGCPLITPTDVASVST